MKHSLDMLRPSTLANIIADIDFASQGEPLTVYMEELRYSCYKTLCESHGEEQADNLIYQTMMEGY